MNRISVCLLLLVMALLLCGCFSQTGQTSTAMEDGASSQAEGSNAALTAEKTGPAEEPAAAPTREQVYAARARLLSGMTEEQIEDLTAFVQSANLWLEQKYLYSDFFDRLEDQDDLVWNYFHKTGEIQIGWAYDGDLEAVCASEGLTKQEAYEKYGQPVVSGNSYDADGFAAVFSAFCSAAHNEELAAILQSISEEALRARDMHDATHVQNLYYTLHDLDYDLLRYWPEDVGPYVTDKSTVSIFYGTLPCYK